MSTGHFPVSLQFGVSPGGLTGASESETWHKEVAKLVNDGIISHGEARQRLLPMIGRIAPPVVTINNRMLAPFWFSKPRAWPRDYSESIVRDVLAFVARGEFRPIDLDEHIRLVANHNKLLAPIRVANACIRRAKSERRIRWCPYSQQYVARPAWQHRPKHDRRGWKWP
jgi:hypothetical protein